MAPSVDQSTQSNHFPVESPPLTACTCAPNPVTTSVSLPDYKADKPQPASTASSGPVDGVRVLLRGRLVVARAVHLRYSTRVLNKAAAGTAGRTLAATWAASRTEGEPLR